MIYSCPRCDNQVEIDLQDGSEYLCMGGSSPCGHTFEIEKTHSRTFIMRSFPGKCCSCFKNFVETEDGLRCPDMCL